MAVIYIPVDRAKLLFQYDPVSGDISRLAGRAVRIGVPLRVKNRHGYFQIKADGKTIPAHRLAWALAHGKWPEQQIDHINGDKTDNRLCNLREASGRVNSENQRRAMPQNKTGFLGVTPSSNWGSKAWRARIMVHGKNINLGTFKTPEAAHAAYVQAKRLHHEGCTL
jgi:hypothetical protein